MPGKPGAPRPRVAVPEVRQNMDRRRLRSAIDDFDPAKNVFGIVLGVFDEYVEVPFVAEGVAKRVEQLVLGILSTAAPVLRDEIVVGEFGLRVLVEHPRVGVRGRVVEVEEVLFYVLAVIAFKVGHAEQPLLQNRVATVPQRDAEAEVLLAVAEAGDGIFIPAICAATSVVVWKVLPRVAVGAVVLAHCSPRAVADVGAPPLPIRTSRRVFREPPLFGAVRHRHCSVTPLMSRPPRGRPWRARARPTSRASDPGRTSRR